MNDEVKIQQEYYSQTAEKYDETHISERGEHAFALSFMVSVIDYFEIRSVLDIGSGTGRVLRKLKQVKPELRIVGVEPVKELREIGYSNGLSDKELIAGDGTDLAFGSGEFDLVCEFGVLHHVKHPETVVDEMLRIAQKGVFISDSNNFGQGSPMARFMKQTINRLRLWPLANFIKTKGKGYQITEGDGLAYS